MKKDLRKNVIALGWVSFLMDTSSEMIFPILPLFLANVLGIPKAFIGIIEGIAESSSSVLKVFSGWLSDKIRKRKSLILLGYGLSAVTKPLFALSTNIFEVFSARFIDRLGKGIRDAPRDALISESVKKKGKWFGFHRMMDTSGAVLGTILAFFLLKWFVKEYRSVFWIATIPAFLAVFVVLFFVKDVKHKISKKLKLSLKGFSKSYKMFILTSIVFNLGNFSYAFFILRAENLGVSNVLIPIIYLVYNIFYAVFSMPAGILSDKFGRKRLLMIGYLIFALTCFSFAFINLPIFAWILFAFYGIQIAIVNGVSRAFVSDLSPQNKKGTAMGIYHTSVGLSLLPASVIAGALWDFFGVTATFLYGGILGILASILILFVRSDKVGQTNKK
ncbi:MAG: MFS transporter [Nanoarchaeota archaeon]|nr:MFS transporter [Nanoarchaeota archaeon]